MFELPNLSARNPLGVIALFISLIYGFGALLLGTSVGSLQKENEIILTLFIVIFPVLVLAVFGWLVAYHHKKLYGPGDFKSDQGFLDANTAADPASLGERLAREASEDIDATVKSDTKCETPSAVLPSDIPDVLTTQTSTNDVELVGAKHKFSTKNVLIQEAYIAETLVFQELQNIFSGTVKREVAISTSNKMRMRVDGIVESKDNVIIVEVKYFKSNKTEIERRIRETVFDLCQYKMQDVVLRTESSDAKTTKILLAIVLGTNFGEIPTTKVARLNELTMSAGIDLKIFHLENLLSKYGLPLGIPDQALR